MRRTKTQPLPRRLQVQVLSGAKNPLIISGLRKIGSKAGARIEILAAIPLPYCAAILPVHWFQWLLLAIALACLGAAIAKVNRVATRARREAARMRGWWERRGARWSQAQREGFRP